MPCLVISDIGMPSIDGFEFLRWVRQHPQLDGVRFALISMIRSPQIEQAAEKLGADVVLIKFPPAEVFVGLVEPRGKTPAAPR
jgi:CheY-like chemotaxis protein